MKRWRAILPILLALVIALSTSFFLYKWLQRQKAPTEKVKVVETTAVPVMVAAVDLPWGTKLKPEMIESTPYLEKSLPPGYFSDSDALEGRVLIASLKQNEAILEIKLAPTSVTTGGVSAVVTPGKRAISVKGDKVLGISGLIKPGNRVDVLATLTQGNKNEITKIVLENVLVLATGKEIQENDKGEPSPVDVYTVEVTPEEGEKLTLAASKGRLQFALRNVTDAEIVLTKGATIKKTLASFRPPVPPRVRVRRSRAKFTVMSGSKVISTEQF
jgi:pilus assembly protein CpaB